MEGGEAGNGLPGSQAAWDKCEGYPGAALQWPRADFHQQQRRARRRRRPDNKRPNRVRQRRRRRARNHRRHRGRRRHQPRGARREDSLSPPPARAPLLRPVNLFGRRAPGMRAPRNTTQFLMHQVYQDMRKGRGQEKEATPVRAPEPSALQEEEDRLLWLQCLGEAMHELDTAATLFHLVKSLESGVGDLCSWFTLRDFEGTSSAETDTEHDSGMESTPPEAQDVSSESY